MDTTEWCDISHLMRTTRHTTPIIAHDMHAWESRKGSKMGTQNTRITEAFSFHESRAYREQTQTQVIRRDQAASTAAQTLTSTIDTEEALVPMALSETAEKWFT